MNVANASETKFATVARALQILARPQLHPDSIPWWVTMGPGRAATWAPKILLNLKLYPCPSYFLSKGMLEALIDPG